MSDGDRSLLFPAIFGLAVCSAGLGAFLTSEWNSAPSQVYQQTGASQQRYKLASAKREYAPYPVKEANSCYQAENHDTADLCAQWRAAIAAEKAAHRALWANWLSIIGAILTLVGTGFVYYTFKETRRTAKAAEDGVAEAGRAADEAAKANRFAATQAAEAAADTRAALAMAARNAAAAEAQVEAARDNARQQLRAWLVPGDHRTEPLDATAPMGGGIRYIIKWKNTGQGPALRALIYSNDRVVRGSTRTPEFIGMQMGPADDHIPLSNIGSNSQTEARARYVTGQDFQDWLSGKARWYVYSRVEYFDAFDQKHVSELCARLHFEGIDVNGDRATMKIDVRYVGGQNNLT